MRGIAVFSLTMHCAIVEAVPFTSAVEFLNALSPFDQFWRDTGSHPCWVFRGVVDAAFPLQAKALRPGELKHYGLGVTAELNPENPREQRRYEQEAVMHFANKCLRAGLPIPEDGQWIRNDDLQKVAFQSSIDGAQESGANFPFPLFRSLYALAQHYEVPTRLLDWSWSPYVAAYFACRNVAREMKKGEKNPKYKSSELVVWALRTAVLDSEFGRADPWIQLVDAPAESNPNLRAQKGIFTLVRNRSPASAEKALPDLETLIRETEIRKFGKPTRGGNWPLLRKHTLPHEKARHLLRLLAGAGIDAATVQPNYEGVATAMTETEFWSDEG